MQSGMLVFDPEQQDQALTWAEKKGDPVVSITRDQLIQMEPTLKQYPSEAFYLPDIAQVRNPRLIAALKQNLLQLNIELFESTEVTELIITQGRAQGINTTTGKHRAKHTVIACGAWSSQMVYDLPVYPVKGQILCYKTTPGYLQHILLRDGNYIIPRKDGYILVGSTLEEVGFNKGPTEQARQHLQHVLESFLPELSDMQFIDQWSGLRPGTPTGLPFIGPVTDIEGLYLNTGHFRNGLLLAPGSARLLADTLLERPSFMAIENFRFSVTKQFQTSEI
jgi:glycine oxidase